MMAAAVQAAPVSWRLPFEMGARDSDIRRFADELAAENGRWWSGISARADMLRGLRGNDLDAALYANHTRAVALVQKLPELRESGIDISALFSDGLPKPGIGLDGIAARLGDGGFCRRKLRAAAAEQAEAVQRNDLNRVHRRAAPYASDAAVKRRREARARTTALLQSLEMINELGQQFSLEALMEKTNANPAIRRAELMVRIAGFEEVARANGDIGEFFTLTCPSRFHRAHARSGAPNAKFSGATPRDGAAYLQRVWARIRTALADADIGVYGFRVAEPHHDGTPHWHGLLFLKPENRREFRRIVALHACREDAAELGLKYFPSRRALLQKAREVQAEQKIWREKAGKKADTLAEISKGWQLEADFWADAKSRVYHFVNARVDFKAIDWSRGTAAGYIAKYIAKNIDGKNAQGESVGEDYEVEGMGAIESAERVQAWASTWRIRQFQQIGGVPVGVWRELRRLDAASLEEDSELTRAACAADAGDWGKFVMIMGGAVMRRDERPLQLYKERPMGGNKYGEEMPAATRGVVEVSSGMVKISRQHEWRMVQKGGKAAPWTCVNNCRFDEAQPREAAKSAHLPNLHNLKMEDADIREWLINGCGWSAAALPEDFGKSRATMLMGMRRWKKKMNERQGLPPETKEKMLAGAADGAAWGKVESGYVEYMRSLKALNDANRGLLESGGIVPAQRPSEKSAGRERLRRFEQPRRVWRSEAETIADVQSVMDKISARMQEMADMLDDDWI